jgi:hypothetical protein
VAGRISGHRRAARITSSTVTTTRFAVGALCAGIVLVATPIAVIGPAEAAAKGCVTRGEYVRVKDGMTRGKVHDIFGSKGRLLFRNPGAVHNSAREYRMCAGWRAATRHSTVQVQYNNYAARGGPQRVVHKQHY